MKRRVHRDRGDLAIEYVIITPIFFILLAMIFVFGRLAEVGGTLDSGTRDAARAASEAPDLTAAQQAARQAVVESLGDNSQHCAGSLTVQLTFDPADFAPGHTVTVTATCDYRISDVGMPGAPGTVTEHSIFSSVIDPNRSLG